MTHPDQDFDAGQRDGTEEATARLLFAGTGAAVVVRGLTWLLSALTVGPLFGLLDHLIGRGGFKPVLALQAVVTVAVVPAAMWCAAGLRTDPARYRRPVRIMSWVFAADVVVYVVPIVVVTALNPAMNLPSWALVVFATISNGLLAWLAVVIARRTRPVPKGPTS